jgi:hypothetical protein
MIMVGIIASDRVFGFADPSKAWVINAFQHVEG